jgi:hypothetical protein
MQSAVDKKSNFENLGAGGSAGAIGFALGPAWGPELWRIGQAMHMVSTRAKVSQNSNQDPAKLFLMFLMWQTATAPLLAPLFPLSQEDQN